MMSAYRLKARDDTPIFFFSALSLLPLVGLFVGLPLRELGACVRLSVCIYTPRVMCRVLLLCFVLFRLLSSLVLSAAKLFL